MRTFKSGLRLGLAAVAIAAALFGPTLVAQQPAGEMFERARMLEETASQNLSEAIQLYQQVAARAAENGALAARAQVRVGALYERLGRTAEARQAYETVISRHATQPQAVADARTRLNAIGGKPAENAGPVMKPIWTAPVGADIEGVVSPDGRYVPYGGPDDLLYVHDLTIGTDRRLTDPVTNGDREFVDETMFSPDGKQLAFSWYNNKQNRSELRIVSLEGTGVPRPRVLFKDDSVPWIGPFDWSPDGKSIAVQLQQGNGNRQMGLMAVADGSLRILRPTAWVSLEMFFSPDGRYLAFDLPASQTNPRRDVFVMPVDGSRDIPVMVNAASHDTIVGWSPDGSHLLFASDRTGRTALWQLRFKDGVVEGQPELLNAELGQMIPMGVSKTGTLYFERLGLRPRGDIQVADFDVNTGRVLSPPVPAAASLVGSVTEFAPNWSPDGKYLAYTSERSDFGGRNFVIAIRSIETGQVRQIVPSPMINFYQGARWWPDGKSFVAAGTDKGRWGVFRIDAETGHASTLFLTGPLNQANGLVAPSPDGTTLYSRRFSGPNLLFVKRDLASGKETELHRRPLPSQAGVNLSPDGRYIATNKGVSAPNPNPVILIPTDGGEIRDLPLAAGARQAGVFQWASDSRSVLLWMTMPNNARELWRVYLDGRAATKLDTNVTPNASVSPDGRHIAIVENSPAKPSEVWVMENFVPRSR